MVTLHTQGCQQVSTVQKQNHHDLYKVLVGLYSLASTPGNVNARIK